MNCLRGKLFLLIGVVALTVGPAMSAPIYVNEDWESGWTNGDFANSAALFYTGYNPDSLGHGSYVKSTVARDTLALELETVPYSGQYFTMDLDNAARTGIEIFDIWIARGATCGSGLVGVYSLGDTAANFWINLSNGGGMSLYAGTTPGAGGSYQGTLATASYGNWYHAVVTCDNGNKTVSASMYDSDGGLLNTVTGYYANTYTGAYASMIKFQGGNAANGSYWYFDDIVYDVPEPVTLLVLLAGGALVQLRRRRA